jgi:serine phosphatase RsbU (regulator of sigma subunit)
VTETDLDPEKVAALQRELERVAQQLHERLAVEARTLRKLADAAVAINSTLSLGEILHVIDESAREICEARVGETILSDGEDLSPLHQALWRDGGTVRMTAAEVDKALSSFGAIDVAPGHPMLEGWLAVPLVSRTGRRRGLLQVAHKLDGDFTESDEVVLTQLAQLAAIAIENAEQYEQEHEIAETLQRSLLPRALPDVKGVEVAARYQPGGAGSHVGGDWYDVIALDDGRLVLTIGDIMGRGPRAAAVMGQLRTAMRAYALQALAPADAMRAVDLLLQDLTEDAMATAAFLVLDPASSVLELVSAGHPPPLLAEPGAAPVLVECDSHTPLGVVSDPLYTATRRVLPSNALLLLYTDGLVEQRDEDLAAGLRRLAAAVDTTEPDLERLCDGILERLAADQRTDDIALLALRLV